MKKALILIAISAAVFAQAGHVPAEWKARYKSLVAAIKSRNVKAYSAFIADEYTWVQPDGKKSNKAEFLAEFDPILKAKKITGNDKLKSVVKRGNFVDVSFEGNFTFVFADNTTMKFHEVGVDTWKKIGGKWQIIRTVDKSVTQTAPKK